MLHSLDIQNVAVIDKLNIEFKSGMTVLTGETGAGKSIIIDAIGMILGSRADKTLVRYNTGRARVQAMLSAKNEDLIPDDSGIECDDGQIYISREISSEGKSLVRINGTMMPQNILRELSAQLVNIHGQHDNQALLTPSAHIRFLDAFAQNSTISDEYKKYYASLRALEKEISDLTMSEQERLRKIDLLEYQLNELHTADLKPGEKDELFAEREIIANSEKIAAALAKAFELLYDGEAAAYDKLSLAADALAPISDYGGVPSEAAEAINGIRYTLEDAVHELKSYGAGIEFDGNRLNDIEERIDVIIRTEKKYGGTTEAALDFMHTAENELDTLSQSGAVIAAKTEELEALNLHTQKLARLLSISRKKAAEKLSAGIESELSDLDMPHTKFIVAITEKTLSSNGADEVEFLISPNSGEPAKPLVKIASGGELSRIMLAIKSILSDADSVETLIFDEIDTGVSGSAAQKIAQKLSCLAINRQVICISHLPQIAAIADNHLKITKSEVGGRATTSITELDVSERELELARMLDGDNITDAALLHAREMLKIAEKYKGGK